MVGVSTPRYSRSYQRYTVHERALYFKSTLEDVPPKKNPMQLCALVLKWVIFCATLRGFDNPRSVSACVPEAFAYQLHFSVDISKKKKCVLLVVAEWGHKVRKKCESPHPSATPLVFLQRPASADER